MSREMKPLDLGEAYRNTLNRHGYASKNSVIQFMKDLHRQGRSEWEFEAEEFPVRVQEMTTRIDFVFFKARPPVYLVGECKRVNPAFSDWCFAKSVHARGRSSMDRLVFQCAWVPPPDKRLVEVIPRAEATRLLTGTIQETSQQVYHLGLSVKSRQKGDSKGPRDDAIEDAAGQVCKGLNGLIEYFNSKRVQLPHDQKFYFMPAIVTTAKIWTTEADLASANIDTGELEPGSVTVKEESWIWYQYAVSPALWHTAPSDPQDSTSPFDLARVLQREFTRSIAIVSVKGIEEFLTEGFPYR